MDNGLYLPVLLTTKWRYKKVGCLPEKSDFCDSGTFEFLGKKSIFAGRYNHFFT